MLGQNNEPSALVWKLLVRLPFGRGPGRLALSGRPFYPGENDYPSSPTPGRAPTPCVAVAHVSGGRQRHHPHLQPRRVRRARNPERLEQRLPGDSRSK